MRTRIEFSVPVIPVVGVPGREPPPPLAMPGGPLPLRPEVPIRHLLKTAGVKYSAPRAPIPPTGIFDPQLSGAALLMAVKEETRRNFVCKSYDDVQRAMYAIIDNVMVDGMHGVYCSYSHTFIPGTSGNGWDYKERSDQNGDGCVDKDGMNVEHLWPQSYFKEKLPMRSDLHHLLPTFMHPNSMRGRLPFGEVADKDVSYQTKAGAKLHKDRLFEPPDEVKGQIARGLFYFYARYYGSENILPKNARDVFWNKTLATLASWNDRCPPDAWERERNNRIEAFQGNRNPFVDDPTLASRIGIKNFIAK